MINKDILLYNFWTTDGTALMQCSGHTNRVRSIDWWDNDQGFSSCCLNGAVYFYELYGSLGLGKRNSEKDFMQKEVKLTSVVNVPGAPYEMFTVGSDRKISSNVKVKLDKIQAGGEPNAGELDMTAKVPLMLSQLCITRSGKNLIAGVGEATRPGSIQVFYWAPQRALDKTNEVQAHSKPIERLRLTYDNKCLFSIGQDGMLCFFDVREGRSGAQKAEPDLYFSN